MSSNTQAPTAFSDVFAPLEPELNKFQSAIQTPKARAAALATVEQCIGAVISSMLIRRNMLVPISILPAEILVYIFHSNAFLVQPCFPSLGLGWANVTHVCRRWRQIALDNSTLWTHFLDYPENKDWITERLSRARNGPLVIDYSGSIMRKDTFSLFIPHISHTRELYLRNLSGIPSSDIIQGISTQRAPALESLELSVSNTSPIEHFVGHSLFKGPLPKLRIFCISLILFPWSLVPRGQLTRLEVTLSEEDFTSDPKVSPHEDLNELIDVLVNCPALEVLTLKNCLPAMLSESPGRQTIHLPRLSRLCLGGSTSRITNLLKMLKLSSSTMLLLDCTSEDTATHNEQLILSILSAHFNDPTPVEFRRFKINLSYCRLEIIASTSLPTPPIAPAYSTPADIDAELRLSLTSLRVYDVNVVDMILRRACDVLPLSKLEFLSISSPARIKPLNWGELFQHFTEISTIQVHGPGSISLLQVLALPRRSCRKGHKRSRSDNGRGTGAQVPNDDDKNAPGPVDVPTFPKLTSLLLEMLLFRNAAPVLHDLILTALKWRKAEKIPFSTLRITHCMISAEEVTALKELVPDFWWDQDEHEREDEEQG